MTNTNHHWFTNTSVTFRKGNFEVTLGHEQPKAVQNVPTPTPHPVVKNKTPWTFQDTAFITVLLLALVLAGRWSWVKIIGPISKFKVF